MSISHWGMFFGFHRAEAAIGGGNGWHAVYVPVAHPDDMVGSW